MGRARKRLKQADPQPVATHGNRFGAHGKEGVDGSSPSEGFTKLLLFGSFSSRSRRRLGAPASTEFRRLAEPCAHLENLARPGLLRPLVHRGGLRADITKDGVIRLGDDIEAIH